MGTSPQTGNQAENQAGHQAATRAGAATEPQASAAGVAAAPSPAASGTPAPADARDAQGDRKPCGADWAGCVPEPAGPVDVTVVMPCYNVEKYLAQCLSSVLQNDEASIEVVVINDGSKDGGLAVMRDFERRDPRVHVIDKPNGGYGMGVNAGLSNAHGAYVAIVEPDDYVRPHFYDETVAFARSFPELPDIVKTPYTRVSQPGTPHERLYHCAYYSRVKPPHQPFTIYDEPRLIQHHPSIWSALYRRAFLEEKGIRMLEVPGAGWVDNPFLIETLCQASSIAFLNKEFYCYREDLPGSSSMLRSSDLAFDRWNQMSDILDRLGVDDEGVRSAHIVRGFNYLTGILEEANIAGTPAERKMRRMFDRMDPRLVLASPYLGNDRKELFCRVRGIEGAKWDRWSHFRNLVSEFWYHLGVNGVAFAMSRVRVYFARRLNIATNDPTKTASAGI